MPDYTASDQNITESVVTVVEPAILKQKGAPF